MATGLDSTCPLLNSSVDFAPLASCSAVSDDEPTSGMSKRQLKKQARLRRYLETKAERRKAEKLRRKKRRQDAKVHDDDCVAVTRRKINKMSESKCGQRVAVDVSFDRLMSHKDVSKTLKQLQHCYSVNRHALNPLQLYLVGFSGKTREKFDMTQGCQNWDVVLKEEPYDTVFCKQECVYLTSESDTVLTELDESKIYIIGGLVDHNVHKGLCYEMARQKGVCHARLPIDEFVRLEGRKVLAINHVFEILLRFSECGDWEKAFFDVIPKRKGLSSLDGSTNDRDKDAASVVYTSDVL